MAKKVEGYIKLQIPAGKATPAPPVGPALGQHGVNIVIYANQLTRSAFPAMQNTAVEILKNHRALEVDARLMPFKEIITLIDDM